MKTILTLSSLIITAGYAAAELAETAGVALPAAINAENALIAFTIVLTLLLLNADYQRASFSLRIPMSSPAAAAAAPQDAGRAMRKSAYGIRRGAEAARLALPPARVVVFAKSPAACCERAA
jgi:hypothetical protein